MTNSHLSRGNGVWLDEAPRRKQMQQDFPASPGRHMSPRRARLCESAPHCERSEPAIAAGLVRIEDIAHALASTCCFAGQTTIFYSLAQHDYLTSMIVAPQDALAALLLDAKTALDQLLSESPESEGYAPTDVLTGLGVLCPLPRTVEHADLVVRATERRDLGRPNDEASPRIEAVTPLPLKIQPLPPIVAKHLFLDRYYELRPQDNSRAFPSPEGTS